MLKLGQNCLQKKYLTDMVVPLKKDPLNLHPKQANNGLEAPRAQFLKKYNVLLSFSDFSNLLN